MLNKLLLIHNWCILEYGHTESLKGAMMFKTVRESFKITNGNIVIATPLIFFSLISSLYMIFSYNANIIGQIFSVILFFLMFGAFLSGWFYMILKAVKEPDIEDNQLITDFPSGVGEYFLSALGLIFQVIFVFSIIIIAAVFAGKKIIGGFGISYSQVVQAASSMETMKTFVDSLSQEQLIKINQWNILMFCAVVFNYFIIMLYPAVILFKNKNPFKAFFISLKDTFGHRFFKNVGLFIFIFSVYTLISIGTMLLGKNIILHFIFTLLNFYYITFAGVLLFNYYYSNFIRIGSNIDETV